MPGKYIIGGKEVSRSTFYRHKDRQIETKNERSLAATRRRLTNGVTGAQQAVELERVDAFLRVVSSAVDGPDNDEVTFTVPRRWLKAVATALPKVA